MSTREEQLISQVEGQIQNIVKTYHIPHYTFEDLQQEARLALLQDMRNYDPSKSKWITFATNSVRNHMNDLVIAAKTEMRKINNNVESWEERQEAAWADCDDHRLLNMSGTENSYKVIEIIDELRSVLKPKQLQVVLLTAKGHTQEYIAELLNISPSLVEGRLGGARNKMKKYYKKLEVGD